MVPLAKVTSTPMSAVIPAISSPFLFQVGCDRSVKFCPSVSLVTLLLLFGREASGQGEVHTSSQGGPLPQYVFLEFGAWGGLFTLV